MTHSSSDNSTNRLIIERMHFNNPYFVISYLLLSDAIYIALVYLGNPTNRIFTEITFITIQFEVIYFAFAIRIGLNKFRQLLEIDKKMDSPLQVLFFFSSFLWVISNIECKDPLYLIK